MKVFKFGGASINSIDRIKNVASIIQSFKGDKIFVIISAMGKTTNALENVVEAFFNGKREEALQLFVSIKKEHNEVAAQLGVEAAATIIIQDIYTEIEWLLYDKPVRDYDYYYDQIVCSGELLSTAIVSSYLNSIELHNNWLDVRDIFRTDDNFRDATIDWTFTQQKVTDVIVPIFSETDIILTQGFIGATDENESTTLGREGSDYSAAIFANMLGAESQTIWKDVEGVMNADPKKFADATFLSELSYDEVIEMAYYGAQVIHPKTIKPLQNKDIPLHVRCFLQPVLKGTIISNQAVHNLPPIIVVKEKQVLMQMSSKDFSFIGETGVSSLYKLFTETKISPNITQSGAISMLCSFDDKPERIEKLALAASKLFEVTVQKNISLLTIRHYNDEIVQQMTAGKNILLLQKTKETIQVLMGEG
jgi:aspartate kinase